MADRVLVAVAVVAVAAILAAYLAIIQSQGGTPSDTPLVVPFVAGYLILMALLLAVSVVVPPALRPALRAAASAGLFVLGVLAAFSIGVAVLIAAGLAIAATVLSVVARPGGRTWASLAVGAIASVAILAGGFQLAWSYIVCQPSGQGSGTTASFLGHGSYYECVDGRLTVH